MAQTKAFEWYKLEQPVAIAGMKADSTVDVIDSYCAETGINPGDVVKKGTVSGTCAPVLTMADTANDAEALGVAIHTQKDYDGEGAYYKQGDAVPVMSFGDVCVAVGEAVNAGDEAMLKFGATGPSFVPSDKTYTTSFALPGMHFMADGSIGDIVPLRVRK